MSALFLMGFSTLEETEWGYFIPPTTSGLTFLLEESLPA